MELRLDRDEVAAIVLAHINKECNTNFNDVYLKETYSYSEPFCKITTVELSCSKAAE